LSRSAATTRKIPAVLTRLDRWRRRSAESEKDASGARLEHRLRDRRNNFDVLRLLAASFVLFSHSYALTAHPEPFADVSGWTFGEIGVVMFFAMSGFLIAKSWGEQPHLWPFAVKRGLRLLPALVVAAFFTTFVVGAIFTVLPLSSYLTHPTTWIYFVRCSFLITFFGKLPGVFLTNPYPEAVNGSLWTLPVEACCYALAAVLGMLGLLRRSYVLLAFAVVLVLFVTPLSSISLAPAGGTTSGNLPLVIMLGATFVLGNLAYSLRARLHLSWSIGAALMALWILTWDGGWARATGIVAIAFAVLVLAFRTPAWLRRLTAPGDLSYGIYVYAFPVQQSVAAIWGAIDPLLMMAIAFPVTYGLAFVSWRLIERPALGLKRLVAPPSITALSATTTSTGREDGSRTQSPSAEVSSSDQA
jgi:peptidoglycan/LPS O-acetylase OafA/YrhL